MHCHAERNPHWIAKLKVERFSSNISIFSLNPCDPWGAHRVFSSLKSVVGIKFVFFVKDVDLLKSLLTHMFCHTTFSLTQICPFSVILVAVKLHIKIGNCHVCWKMKGCGNFVLIRSLASGLIHTSCRVNSSFFKIPSLIRGIGQKECLQKWGLSAESPDYIPIALIITPQSPPLSLFNSSNSSN